MRHHPAVLLLPVTMLMATPTLAAPNVSVSVNPANTIPGVVANSIFADGGGIDWTGAALGIVLDQGEVYNAPEFDTIGAPAQAFIDLIPDLEFDSWLGIVDSPSGGGFAGRSGDVGIPEAFPDQYGLSGPGHQSISATWFNLAKTETGPNRIGNISLTDDACGTWSVGVTFAFTPTLYYLTNPIVNGELVWDPLHGDLDFNGFVGINDLSTVLGVWNQNVPVGSTPDPSEDGFVGIEDLGEVLSNWNEGLAPRPTVPVVMNPPGDADGDGFVGINDKVWTSNWNTFVTPGDLSARDTSGDGYVGLDDLNILLSNWNAGTPPLAGGSVPEPTSAFFMSTFVSYLICRRGRGTLLITINTIRANS